MNTKPRLLITGASGFLGGLLATYFKKTFTTTIVYHNNTVTISGCEELKLDLTDRAATEHALKITQPDVIIHCAAQPNAAICQKDRRAAEDTNVYTTRNIVAPLSASILFIHISTDLVYPGNTKMATESTPTAPVSVYGETKRRAEQIVTNSKANAIILRTALMYGPVAPSGKGSFVQWMDTSLQKGQPLKLFSDEYRTPLYALDVAKVIERLINAKAHPHRLYNLGGPECITRLDFGKKLAALRGYNQNLIQPITLDDLHTGYPRPADVSMDSSRLTRTLGISLTRVEEGLKKVFT